MKLNINCPICGNETDSQYYGGEQGLAEAYTSCKVCGYFDSFSYGAYEHSINGKYWSWYYDTPEPEKQKIFKQIKREEEKEKRKWSLK